MHSLRLTNFRSFRDTGKNKLKPITILVGTNSSGKSSYLRFFPLLRQTAEMPSRSPLLWFGGLVDFGDFSKAASRTNKPASLGYEIELDIPAAWRRTRDVTIFRATIAVTLRAEQGQTYVSHLEFMCGQDVCVIDFSSANEITSFASNGIDMMPYYKQKPLGVIVSGFFPTISLLAADSDLDYDPRYSPMNAAIAARLSPLAHNRTKPLTIMAYANRLSYCEPAIFLDVLRGLDLRFLPNPKLNDTEVQSMRALVLARDLGHLLRGAQRAMAAFASGINYLGPFRKDPERFYRQQELSVAQIEPHGENLAMFLRSLTVNELNDLSAFMFAHLGFKVHVDNEGTHVSVTVEENHGGRYNLIDMGYGLSQVLPVIAQCWSTARDSGVPSERYRLTTMLAIEQPELHLHPSHQARLADMFAAVLTAVRLKDGKPPRRIPTDPVSRFPLRIMLETHSEAMVNRFGELIEGGVLTPDDVAVMLFEKDQQTGLTSIRNAEFLQDGTLQNWPVGFFAP